MCSLVTNKFSYPHFRNAHSKAAQYFCKEPILLPLQFIFLLSPLTVKVLLQPRLYPIQVQGNKIPKQAPNFFQVHDQFFDISEYPPTNPSQPLQLLLMMDLPTGSFLPP